MGPVADLQIRRLSVDPPLDGLTHGHLLAAPLGMRSSMVYSERATVIGSVRTVKTSTVRVGNPWRLGRTPFKVGH
jgi:hypothetical protein